MSTEISINKVKLKEALNFLGDDDIRIHLRHVIVDTSEKGAALVATNGAFIFVHKIDSIPRDSAQYFLKKQDVIAAIKPTGLLNLAAFEILESGDFKTNEDSFLECEKLPHLSWRSVINADCKIYTDSHVSFDPELLYKINTAGQRINKTRSKTYVVSPISKYKGYCKLSEDCFVWIMNLNMEQQKIEHLDEAKNFVKSL